MDFATAIQSVDPKNNLLHYLIRYGSKKKLDQLIVDLERANPNNPICFHAILTSGFNKLWELPTRELCLGLISLFKYLGIDTINELGAGMAMLSALLDHYAKREKLNLKISASSKFDCTFLYDNRFTYYPVVNETFANYRGTDPIIISWLHSAVENELMTVIIAQKPPYIFLIGGHSFDKQLQLIGYHPYIIPFKQVCLSDYITGDIFRKIPIGVVSRSCTVMYSLKLLELDIRKIIGLENIGIHHALTSDYVTQDIWLRFKGKLYV